MMQMSGFGVDPTKVYYFPCGYSVSHSNSHYLFSFILYETALHKYVKIPYIFLKKNKKQKVKNL